MRRTANFAYDIDISNKYWSLCLQGVPDVEIAPSNGKGPYAPVNTQDPEKGGITIINGYHGDDEAGINSRVQLLDSDPSKLESTDDESDDEPEGTVNSVQLCDAIEKIGMRRKYGRYIHKSSPP